MFIGMPSGFSLPAKPPAKEPPPMPLLLLGLLLNARKSWSFGGPMKELDCDISIGL